MNSSLLIPNAQGVLILYPALLINSNDVPHTVCELQTAATAESPPVYCNSKDLWIPLTCKELSETYTELSRWLFREWPDSSPNGRILVISGSQSNLQNVRLLLNIGNAFLKVSNARLSKTEVCHFTLTTKEKPNSHLLRLACMTQEIWKIIAIHHQHNASPTRYNAYYSKPNEFFEMESRRSNAV